MTSHGSSPPEFTLDAGTSDLLRVGLLQSVWRGAKTGFRRSAYIAVPIALLLAIPGLTVTLYFGGAGRGWAIPAFLQPGSVICGVILAGGALVGALFGLLRGVFRLALPKASHRPEPAPGTPAIRGSHSERPKASSIDGESPKPRRRRLRRLARALCVLMLLAFTAVLLFGMLVGSVVDTETARASAAADRDDPFWRINDVLGHRAAVPDAENSAAVVMRVAARLPKYFPPDGSTATFEVLKMHQELLMLMTDNERFDEEIGDALRNELKVCRESVRIARTLVNYSRGGYEIELGPNIIDTKLPGPLKIRNTTRLLYADCAIRVHDQDPDGALESCRAILGAGRSLGDEPFILSQTVRIGTGIEALKAVRRVLGQGEPSDRALQQMQELVLDERAQPLILHALKGERATNVEIVRRLAAGEVTMDELIDTSTFDPRRPRRAVAPWTKLWLDHERAVMLDWMNDAANIERQPYAERFGLWRKWQKRFDARPETINFWAVLFPLKMFPGLFSAAHSAFRFHADLGASAILLAAERHRKKTGKWPESIAAIDKDILSDAPTDPFSGQPYRFVRRDGQLLIYSIGPNQKDEQGERDAERHLNGGPDDIAARAWDTSLRRQPSPAEEDETD
jgi:hypothetical protein